MEQSKFQTIHKSFARRKYKTISKSGYQILENLYQAKAYSSEKLLRALSENISVSLEIGFGRGEHLINQLYQDKTKFFIGCEVFINGIINFLRIAQKLNLENYLLFHDDINILIEKIPNQILENIYILFPDPWPKSKQKKRRLVNDFFINRLLVKLRVNSTIRFVSDHLDYVQQVCLILNNSKKFQVTLYENDFSNFENYLPTKYHKKSFDRPIFYIYAKYVAI